MLLVLGAGTASAASPVEGVWAFNGGQIAIQPLSNATFVGTVVTETSFAECAHPVGQQIWTDIRAQPDGSFWGLHQWYFEKSSCIANPTLGLAAFRVLSEPNGSRYLKVCLSNPGTTQPTIAADGSTAGATYGCVKSALSAVLPTSPETPGSTTPPGTSTPKTGAAGFKELVTLPNSKKCFSARSFLIHIDDPRYDAFKTVSITIKGHRIKWVRRGGVIIATISLKGLPQGAFTVVIKATTYLGRHMSGSRTYHTCAKKSSRHKASTKLH